MRFLFRHHETKSEPIEGERKRQKSLALKRLLPTSEGERAPRVLDLGIATRDTLEFFGRYGAHLTIADFYRCFLPARAAAASKEESVKAEIFRKLLPYDDAETRFDLVLAWDVLNYLDPEEITLLMTSLDRFCEPGTALLAFIATAREMPPSPSVYRIEDEETIAYEVKGGRPRRCPRYLEPELVKLLPGLSVENRFQLRNGMLEYVFSYRMRQRGATLTPSDVLERSRWDPLPRWTPAPSR